MFGYLSWEEVKKELLKRGLGNILTTTPPIDSTTPKSLRPKPTSSVVGDRKQKKPKKALVR